MYGVTEVSICITVIILIHSQSLEELECPANPMPGVGNLLVVLCQSNVAESQRANLSPPFVYIQQLLKQLNLILY
jgi:hypothetical protein